MLYKVLTSYEKLSTASKFFTLQGANDSTTASRHDDNSRVYTLVYTHLTHTIESVLITTRVDLDVWGSMEAPPPPHTHTYTLTQASLGEGVH